MSKIRGRPAARARSNPCEGGTARRLGGEDGAGGYQRVIGRVVDGGDIGLGHLEIRGAVR